MIFDKIDMSILDRFAVLTGGVFVFESLIGMPVSSENLMVLSTIIWILSNRDHFNFENMISDSRIKALLKVALLYDSIIDDYMLVQKKMGFDDPIYVMAFYSYMFKNGFLSEKCSFNYSTDPEYDLMNFYEFDIINGRGCCRNIAPFLSNIYDRLDIKNFKLISYHPDGVSSRYARKHGNHVILACVYEGKRYLTDPTNNTIYVGEDTFVSDGSHDLVLFPKNGFLENNMDYKDKKNILSLEDGISIDDYKEISSDVFDICECNDDMIFNFYLKEKEKYKIINEKMRSVKKSLL